MIQENFDKVYNAFAKKDYFGTKSRIKTQLGNWKRAIEKGDEGAKKYTEKDIIDSMEATAKLEASVAYGKLKKAIEKKDINYLKSILRHDQKFSQALFMDITGKRLPKTTKEIQSFLDDMFKNESVNETVSLSKVQKEVDKFRKEMKNTWARTGGTENFGQRDLKKLEDKYVDSSDYSPDMKKIRDIFQDLDNWLMNFNGKNESINEASMDNYISSTDGKTFTIYNKDKKKIKNVSKEDLVNKYMKGQPNMRDLVDKFDKTTGKGKHWKYWKGILVNVSIKNISETVNEAKPFSTKIGGYVMYKGTKSILKKIKRPSKTVDIEWNDEYIEVPMKDISPVNEDATKIMTGGGLKNWRKYSPEDVMSFVYWTKRQIPPSDNRKWAKSWNDIKKQLEKKFPVKEDVNEAAEYVIHKIKDIPNLKKLVDAGKVTYRGIPSSNSITNKLYSLVPDDEGVTRIKVDGKEYYITDTDFKKLGGIKKIRFSASFRKG